MNPDIFLSLLSLMVSLRSMKRTPSSVSAWKPRTPSIPAEHNWTNYKALILKYACNYKKPKRTLAGHKGLKGRNRSNSIIWNIDGCERFVTSNSPSNRWSGSKWKKLIHSKVKFYTMIIPYNYLIQLLIMIHELSTKGEEKKRFLYQCSVPA